MISWARGSQAVTLTTPTLLPRCYLGGGKTAAYPEREGQHVSSSWGRESKSSPAKQGGPWLVLAPGVACAGAASLDLAV